MAAKRADEAVGKHRNPVLGALAVAHEDGPATEIDVLHPQPDRFHDAHARAVQQFTDEPVTTIQGAQKPGNLGARKHRRQSRGSLRPHDTIEPAHVLAQHLAMQKQQRALRLILRRRSDVQVYSEVRQELLYLIARQFRRMAIAVESNEAFDPVNIRLFSPDAVALEADSSPHLFQQTGASRRDTDVFRTC